MATGKKSFVLYTSYIHAIELLTDDQAGKLLKLIFNYVNDLNPEENDVIVKLAFEPIKQQLKRDLIEWRSERKRRSAAGKVGGLKSGEARRSKAKQNEVIVHSASKNEANEAVDVDVDVDVDVNVEEKGAPVFYSIEHCLTIAMNDDRWVKANKVSKPDLLEFNGLLEKRGVYTKNPMDYKTHFANWKLGGKKELPQDNSPAYNPNGHLKPLR